MAPAGVVTVGLAAVEAAVRDLDLATIADARWFAAKGSVPTVGARRARLRAVGRRGARARRPACRRPDATGMRWRSTRPAARVARGRRGRRAWRALAAAIAEGRTIAAMPRDGERRGTGRRRWSVRPSPGLADAVGRRRGRTRRGSRRATAGPRPVEHVGRPRRAAAAQGLSPDPARPQPRPRADRLPVGGGGVPRRAAPRRLGRGRDARRRRRHRRDAPGVRARRRGRVRVDGRAPRRAHRRARTPPDLEARHGHRRGPRDPRRRAPRGARVAARRCAGPGAARRRPRRPASLAHGRDPPAERRRRRRRRRSTATLADELRARRAGDHRALLALRGRRHGPARHAHPRRPPPRPGADRRRRVSRDRLRGRAAAADRGPAPPRLAAARRGLDAAVARPRRAERPSPRRGAGRRPDRAPRPRRRGLDRARPRAVPRGVCRYARADRRPDRRRPRPPRRVRGRQGGLRVRVRRDGAADVAVGAARRDALAARQEEDPRDRGRAPRGRDPPEVEAEDRAETLPRTSSPGPTSWPPSSTGTRAPSPRCRPRSSSTRAGG